MEHSFSSYKKKYHVQTQKAITQKNYNSNSFLSFSEAKLVKTWTTLLQSQEIAHTPIKMSFYHIYIGSKKLIKFLLHSSNK